MDQIIAKQWTRCSQQADEDLANIPEDLVMRIRYEDFVARPVELFEQV